VNATGRAAYGQIWELLAAVLAVCNVVLNEVPLRVHGTDTNLDLPNLKETPSMEALYSACAMKSRHNLL
jgi:hypothetical protein